jgi:hypothetical protein
LQAAMTEVDGATIARRIRINRPDDGSARCKGSKALDRRKDFSQPTPQPTTLSTSNVISPQQERTEPSGRLRCRRGAKPLPRLEPGVREDLLRVPFADVMVWTPPTQRRRSAIAWLS